MGTYSYTGKPQIVTVQQTDKYIITAYGAQGGSQASSGGGTGGLGAEVTGYVQLTAGEKLEVFVGGMGRSAEGAGGGGGGTFVLANTGAGGSYVPLIIAGGGGGAENGAPGASGTVSFNGVGKGGAGGTFTNTSGKSTFAGGGAGVKSDGGGGSLGGQNGTGQYAGGTSNNSYAGAGGFGGGGAGSKILVNKTVGYRYFGGGGGGSFGGAGGGVPADNSAYYGAAFDAAGGGGSFDGATVIPSQTLADVNAGAGYVSIKIPLFTTGADVVDFNALTASQQAAAASGADLYQGLGGSDDVTLPDVANYNESVGGGATLGWDPSKTFYTGSLPGDNYSIVGGDGDYKIQLGAGNDSVTLDGNGASTISLGTGSNTIALAASGSTVNFIGSNETATLKLAPGLSENVDGLAAFGTSDTIDLSGQTANEDVYDPSTGDLKLYDTSYGQSTTEVADLNLTGTFNNSSFALSPDGNGGTSIKLGAPPPTLGQLAALANAAYSGSSTSTVFTLLQSTTVNGFYAAAFGEYSSSQNYPDQIVIAIRGTDYSSINTSEKNLSADAAFASGSNAYLSQYVQAASQLLAQVRQTYPDAPITLTGHSLGGGIAALVGQASDYPTVTFDAPGGAQLESSLSTSLQQASSSNSELSNLIVPFNSTTALPTSPPSVDTAYRLEGDQVSLQGTQIGTVYTIPTSGGQGWLYTLYNHSLNTLIQNIGTTPVPGAPDAPLTGSITTSGSTLSGGTLTETLPTTNVAAGTPVDIDPAAASGYQVSESALSPLFTSIGLPVVPGVASYSVSLDTANVPGPAQYLSPGHTLTSPTPFDGFEFTPLDANGNPVQPDGAVVFQATFATAGSFTGQIVADVGTNTGNSPVVSSPTLTVAQNAAATPIGIMAPSDPNYLASALSIAVVDLPADGTVTLADGVTPVTPGESLTLDQLTGLDFTPTPGVTEASGTFDYTATDPSNNASVGTAALAIGQPAVCFVAGTRIRVARGAAMLDLAMEDLVVGDLAVTVSGDLRPICWLGHREICCADQPEPWQVRPIRIAAHAFGAELPTRDLCLSPGHPVLVGAGTDGEGGCLVPIMCLINGTTIERMKVDSVTYWHVELDEHDILLAEGLPAESYFDLGSRPWFDGTNGSLYDPDLALPGMPGRCRPVAIDGPVVERERRRLDAVFAMQLVTACAWPNGTPLDPFESTDALLR